MRHVIVALTTILLLATTATAVEMDWKPESKWRRGKGTTVASLIRKAETAEKRGQFKRAIKIYADIETRSVNLRNRAKAVVMQGICYDRLGKPHPAADKFARAVDEFGTFIPFAVVQQHQIDIANRFYFGEKERMMGLAFSNVDKALEIYDSVAEHAPYGALTPTALYRGGLIAQQLKNYGGAIERFEKLLKRFPPNHSLAVDTRVDLANTLLLWAAQGDGDGTLVARAKRELETLRKTAGEHARIAEIDSLLGSSREMEAARLLYLGEFYQRDAHPRFDAARRYLQQVVTNFSDTASAGAASALLSALNMHSAALGESEELTQELEKMPELPPAPAPQTQADAPRTVSPPQATTRTLPPHPVESAEEPAPKHQSPRSSGRWLRPLDDLNLGGEANE
ncbi:MAG TPA: hypothetical protein DCR55_16415 [Lentisphaeria bacterium]|nr:hypothetical protein [Lentisphaeria bacterium]